MTIYSKCFAPTLRLLEFFKKLKCYKKLVIFFVFAKLTTGWEKAISYLPLCLWGRTPFAAHPPQRPWIAVLQLGICRMLNKHEIKSSMTESGDPLENPVAERVNGIMKEEYLEPASVKLVKEAIAYLHKTIALYNTERPHMSISNYTPNQVHYAEQPLELKRIWKNYYNKKKPTVNQCQD